MMQRGKHIVYLDESTFHQWLVPTRAWVTKYMTLQMPSSRGSSISVIAAISERQGLIHYKIINGSNDSATFSDFVYELVRKIRGDACVYMDNYSVHRSKSVTGHFNDRIVQFFLPPYSCALNPIEKLWKVVKEKWRKRML